MSAPGKTTKAPLWLQLFKAIDEEKKLEDEKTGKEQATIAAKATEPVKAAPITTVRQREDAKTTPTSASDTEAKSTTVAEESPVDKVLKKIVRARELAKILGPGLDEYFELSSDELDSGKVLKVAEHDIDACREYGTWKCPPLSYAVLNAVPSIVAKLINFGVDLDSVVSGKGASDDGITALIYAAYYGKIEIVRMLLLAGANADLCAVNGCDALYWLICSEKINLTQKLATLEVFFNPMETSDPKGAVQTTSKLKPFKTNRTYKRNEGNLTLLDICVESGNHSIAEFLLKQKPEADLFNKGKDWKVGEQKCMHSPFTRAIQKQDEKMVGIILQQAGELLAWYAIVLGIKLAIELKNINMAKFILNHAAITQKTAPIDPEALVDLLDLTVNHGSEELLTHLLKQPKLEKCNFDKYSKQWLGLETKIAESLQDAVRKRDLGALGYAAYKNDVEGIRKQLAEGVDVNALCPNGWPALAIAAEWGRLDVVKVLIEAKAEIDKPIVCDSEESGETALMQACYQNYPEVASELLKAGANPHLQDREKLDAVFWALQPREEEKEEQRLANLKVFFDAQGQPVKGLKLDQTYEFEKKEDKTPLKNLTILDIAIEYRWSKVVRYLLEQKLDDKLLNMEKVWRVKDRDYYHYPITRAIREGDKEIVGIILDLVGEKLSAEVLIYTIFIIAVMNKTEMLFILDHPKLKDKFPTIDASTKIKFKDDRQIWTQENEAARQIRAWAQKRKMGALAYAVQQKSDLATIKDILAQKDFNEKVITTEVSDCEGNKLDCPLLMAINNKQEEVVFCLLDHITADQLPAPLLMTALDLAAKHKLEKVVYRLADSPNFSQCNFSDARKNPCLDFDVVNKKWQEVQAEIQATPARKEINFQNAQINYRINEIKKGDREPLFGKITAKKESKKPSVAEARATLSGEEAEMATAGSGSSDKSLTIGALIKLLRGNSIRKTSPQRNKDAEAVIVTLRAHPDFLDQLEQEQLLGNALAAVVHAEVNHKPKDEDASTPFEQCARLTAELWQLLDKHGMSYTAVLSTCDKEDHSIFDYIVNGSNPARAAQVLRPFLAIAPTTLIDKKSAAYEKAEDLVKKVFDSFDYQEKATKKSVKALFGMKKTFTAATPFDIWHFYYEIFVEKYLCKELNPFNKNFIAAREEDRNERLAQRYEAVSLLLPQLWLHQEKPFVRKDFGGWSSTLIDSMRAFSSICKGKTPDDTHEFADMIAGMIAYAETKIKQASQGTQASRETKDAPDANATLAMLKFMQEESERLLRYLRRLPVWKLIDEAWNIDARRKQLGLDQEQKAVAVTEGGTTQAVTVTTPTQAAQTPTPGTFATVGAALSTASAASSQWVVDCAVINPPVLSLTTGALASALSTTDGRVASPAAPSEATSSAGAAKDPETMVNAMLAKLSEQQSAQQAAQP